MGATVTIFRRVGSMTELTVLRYCSVSKFNERTDSLLPRKDGHGPAGHHDHGSGPRTAFRVAPAPPGHPGPDQRRDGGGPDDVHGSDDHAPGHGGRTPHPPFRPGLAPERHPPRPRRPAPGGR